MADLISLAEYKIAKGITSTKEDVRLSATIVSVSQLVKTYCANSLIDYFTTPYVELFNIRYNTSAVQLTESPLRSIISVQERVRYSEAYKILNEATFEFYWDPLTDSIIRTTGSGETVWPKGPGSVKVTYTAGYTDTPEDLKLAVIDLVAYYHREEYKERQTLSSSTLERPGSSSQPGNVGFPDHIKRVLDLYKNFF